jgi:hypothetical protein
VEKVSATKRESYSRDGTKPCNAVEPEWEIYRDSKRVRKKSYRRAARIDILLLLR